jgi:hypothetical protein
MFFKKSSLIALDDKNRITAANWASLSLNDELGLKSKPP